MTFTKTFSPIGGQGSTIDLRLRAAIGRLRTQCDARRSVTSEIRKKSPESDSSEEFNRMHAVQDMLIKSRAREADLEDEIDTLKCKLIDSEYRIRELESIVDDWRNQYHLEVARSNADRVKAQRANAITIEVATAVQDSKPNTSSPITSDSHGQPRSPSSRPRSTWAI